MYFIGSDKPEHIQKVIENFPWFAELYEDVAYFRHHPEEAIGMFSEALRKLDENTINFMIDDMKGEIDGLKKELADKDRKLLEQEQEILELKKLLAEKKSNEKSM